MQNFERLLIVELDMQTDLQIWLFHRYPGLYAQFEIWMKKTGMVSALDVDDGWFSIINALSAVLSRLGSPLRVVQVKQKFGTLRYHVSPTWCRGGPNAITAAEMFSSRICEVTGQPGDLMSTPTGAVRTLSLQPAAWLAAGAPPPQNYSPHPPVEDDFPIPAPPASIRMGWSDSEANEALRLRHGLEIDCQIEIPAALFDLADCVIQTIAPRDGRWYSDVAGPRPKFHSIVWNQKDGLTFSIDETSIAAVARAEIEARSAYGPAETSIEKELAEFVTGINGVRAFAAEMSRRIDLAGGGISQEGTN